MKSNRQSKTRFNLVPNKRQFKALARTGKGSAFAVPQMFELCFVYSLYNTGFPSDKTLAADVTHVFPPK